MNYDGVWVRLAVWTPLGPNGGGFKFEDTAKRWTERAYYGDLSIPRNQPVRFQDWNNDGYADAIVVNTWGITVRLSDGQRFTADKIVVAKPFYGSAATLFLDVTYDGTLDVIALNN